MSITRLEPCSLGLTIDPDTLEFPDTSTLIDQPLDWIGQERARQATYFGLEIEHSDYNLFVLGETGSGRSSLLRQAMSEVAAHKSVPPDLCYVHNFAVPECPLALRLPAGKGIWLRQQLVQAVNRLLQEIRGHFSGDDFKAELSQIKSLLDQVLSWVTEGLDQSFSDYPKLEQYLNDIKHDILKNLDLFQLTGIDEDKNPEDLKLLFERYRVNVVVNNLDLLSAPVVIDENPSFKSLIGSIGYQTVEGILTTDFARIRAGNLLKAHGGFLMLHLDDLLADAYLWEKFCRLLRNHVLQIEEPWIANVSAPVIPIEPEAVKINVRIILIGSREQYYAIQEENPELARRFRVKVDFSATFTASAQAYRALSVFIAHICQKSYLPHFSREAVAAILKTCHRTAEDQKRLSTNFSHTEMLIVESALQSRARGSFIVEARDVVTAHQARMLRHNYPDQCVQEAIADGDVIITVHGEKVGQVNGLSLIEMGDYSFGTPSRITAHTFAGEEGLLNIEREVGMSGPIHDKGVFILQNFLSALFHHNAPLALNASVVFEQEYYGIEGDSASCAELYALLSALSGLPFRQGVAITGAINQYGEMLPIGGVNEKIEGFFRVCKSAGLDGMQGVLIPDRNCHHLMLDDEVVDAVSKGMFHIYAISHMQEGLELLSGLPAGISNDIELHEITNYLQDTVLGYAQKTLRAYRMACQQIPQRAKTPHKRPGEHTER